MFATLFSVALFAAPAIRGVLADFTVTSPSMTQCASTHFSWDATTGPYNVIIVPSDDPCGDPIVDLGDHTSTSITWNVTIASGTSVLISVADGSGDEAWSNDITVGGSSDSSCLASSSASASASASYSSAYSTPSSSASSTLSYSYSSTTTSLTVVVPTTTVDGTTPVTTISTTATESGSAVAAGAANAGDLPTSEISGSTSTHIAMSAVVLSTLAGALALAF